MKVVPSTPQRANSRPASEYHSQSMNCIMATKFLLSRAFEEIMMPFSSRGNGLISPAGPIGSGILAIFAFGRVLARSGRWLLTSVCALPVTTKDLPLASFWRAWSSVWVKLSGSSRPSATSLCRYVTICLYCSDAPV